MNRSGYRVPAKESGSDPRVAVLWRALATVLDPEIPVIDVVEMGMVADVRTQGEDVVVDLAPTFAGCPALDHIRSEIRRAIAEVSAGHVTVNIVFDPPWTSDRITEEGRRKLKEFGLAPPARTCGERGSAASEARDLSETCCPYCDSPNTKLESLFGPTLCRSIHYCHNCLQSFERFKDV